MKHNDTTHRLALAMNTVFTTQQINQTHPETIEFVEASSFQSIGDDSKVIRYYTAEKVADIVGYTGADYSHAVTNIFEFFEDTERLLRF